MMALSSAYGHQLRTNERIPVLRIRGRRSTTHGGAHATLRARSSRATITPTRFSNFYTWGDFNGDPAVLMDQYFDAFVYVANWGLHELMLRLPRRLLSPR